MNDMNTPNEWKTAAIAAQAEGRLTEAVTAWRELLWLRPDDLEALAGLAACGEVKAAIEGLQGLLRKNPDYGPAYYQLGRVWLELGEWDKAERALQQAPDDDDTEAALQQLARERGTLGGTYARHLFNDYAPKFEEALARLGYQAPQLINTALQPYYKTGQRIIDLGCGTGLMAPYLKPYAAKLVGVDIAEKMLAIAAKRGLYDELIADDMVAALKEQWDLIVAADAVVYIGDLAPLLQAAAKALLPHGVLAMSVEVNGLESGYVLQESKRHAHSISYIKSACSAAGLMVVSQQDVVLRQDRGANVNGAILVISPTI